MKNVRRIGVAVAAVAISFGLLGLSAPAHAKAASAKDISWEYGSAAVATGPVSL